MKPYQTFTMSLNEPWPSIICVTPSLNAVSPYPILYPLSSDYVSNELDGMLMKAFLFNLHATPKVKLFSMNMPSCLHAFGTAHSASVLSTSIHHISQFSQFSHSVMSDSLQSHGLQHTRPPCPSPTPRACSNSCP